MERIFYFYKTMQEEKDYLKKEIEKLIHFLKRVLETYHKEPLLLENETFQEEFTSYFNISLKELINLTDDEFTTKVHQFDSKILEKLLALFSEISKKPNIVYAKKTLILLQLIDEKEKTFSFERMTLKQQLEKLVNES